MRKAPSSLSGVSVIRLFRLLLLPLLPLLLLLRLPQLLIFSCIMTDTTDRLTSNYRPCPCAYTSLAPHLSASDRFPLMRPKTHFIAFLSNRQQQSTKGYTPSHSILFSLTFTPLSFTSSNSSLILTCPPHFIPLLLHPLCLSFPLLSPLLTHFEPFHSTPLISIINKSPVF